MPEVLKKHRRPRKYNILEKKVRQDIIIKRAR